MILLVAKVICLYIVNGKFVCRTIPKLLEMYIKLVKILTLPLFAGFCEVLDIFPDVKCHIIEWELT